MSGAHDEGDAVESARDSSIPSPGGDLDGDGAGEGARVVTICCSAPPGAALRDHSTRETRREKTRGGAGRQTTEGRLPGARPARASRDTAAQVAAFTAGLPTVDAPPSVLADLTVVADHLPDRADRLLAVAAAVDAELHRLPTAARHGDLWSGNVLVTGAALSGVLDWDAWSPSSAPTSA